MITREQIVAVAKSYKGVKYADQGRSRDEGFDCVGLLITVGNDLGYFGDHFDYKEYGKNPDGETMDRLLNEHMDKIDISEAQPGDVLSMDFGNSPQHCGFISKVSDRGIPYWVVVHALRDYGVVEGRLFSKYLNSVKAVYRLRGVTVD